MDYNKLLAKYYASQSKNHHLREENKRLRLPLGILEQLGIPFGFAPNLGATEPRLVPEMMKVDFDELETPDIHNLSTSEKIKRFMALFKGRNDIYAKKWENKKKGISGNKSRSH